MKTSSKLMLGLAAIGSLATAAAPALAGPWHHHPRPHHVVVVHHPHHVVVVHH